MNKQEVVEIMKKNNNQKKISKKNNGLQVIAKSTENLTPKNQKNCWDNYELQKIKQKSVIFLNETRKSCIQLKATKSKVNEYGILDNNNSNTMEKNFNEFEEE